MTAEELQTLIAEDPDAAAAKAAEAINAERQRAEGLASEKAKILANKEQVLVELREYKALGKADQLAALKLAAEEEAALEAANDSDGDDSDGAADPPKGDDATARALKLAERRAEAKRQLAERRHAEALQRVESEKAEALSGVERLQAEIDTRERNALLRAAFKGRQIENLEEHLFRKLGQCLRKEADGEWGLYNPRTDESMPSARGGPMSVDELVEAAMLSQGSDPWNSRLAECFKKPEGGSGLTRAGAASPSADISAMSQEQKMAYIAKFGADKFGEQVNAMSAGKAAQMQKAIEAARVSAAQRFTQ